MIALLGQTTLSSEQTEMVQIIQSSGDVLLNTINGILDFNKIKANKIELEAIAFSPATCIQDTLALLQVQAREKGVCLKMEVASDCHPVVVQDVCRIRQVLVNLVGNAIKFSSRGTAIKVMVGPHRGEPLHAPRVRDASDSVTPSNAAATTSSDATEIIHFSVQDCGIGIPPERLPSLFDSFTQVDASTTRKYGGSGLGLCISKELAELMGGKMWVESSPGIGSTFHFTIEAKIGTSLPVTVAPSRSFNPHTALGDQSPLKILLVEDVKVNQKVALSFLDKLGFRDVVVTEDGQQAVRAAADTAFDLVLLDLHMPVMDGYEAARHIRRAETSFGRRTRIVAVTADATAHRRCQAMRAGMDDFLSKPLRVEELTKALERCVLARRDGDLPKRVKGMEL